MLLLSFNSITSASIPSRQALHFVQRRLSAVFRFTSCLQYSKAQTLRPNVTLNSYSTQTLEAVISSQSSLLFNHVCNTALAISTTCGSCEKSITPLIKRITCSSTDTSNHCLEPLQRQSPVLLLNSIREQFHNFEDAESNDARNAEAFPPSNAIKIRPGVKSSRECSSA